MTGLREKQRPDTGTAGSNARQAFAPRLAPPPSVEDSMNNPDRTAKRYALISGIRPDLIRIKGGHAGFDI
jgi:hypothetical protein